MEEDKDYIEKWVKGTLSEKERALFEKTDEYHQLEKLSRHLDAMRAPDYNTSAEFDALLPKLKKEARTIKMPVVKILLRAAAVVTLLVASYFIFFQDKATNVQTLAAQTQKIQLPDHTEVTLGPQSQLTFTKSDWPNSRMVQLTGQAFFSVAKGSRFEVQTDIGTISVLGTRFSVNARQEIFEVICYEGSVQVDAYHQTATLKPSHVFRAIEGRVIDNNVSRLELEEWSASESTFHSTPYKFVLAEFERQYDLTIKTEGINTKQLFTGKFPNSDLNTALNTITIPLNLEYKILEDHTVHIWSASK